MQCDQLVFEGDSSVVMSWITSSASPKCAHHPLLNDMVLRQEVLTIFSTNRQQVLAIFSTNHIFREANKVVNAWAPDFHTNNPIPSAPAEISMLMLLFRLMLLALILQKLIIHFREYQSKILFEKLYQKNPHKGHAHHHPLKPPFFSSSPSPYCSLT